MMARHALMLAETMRALRTWMSGDGIFGRVKNCRLLLLSWCQRHVCSSRCWSSSIRLYRRRGSLVADVSKHGKHVSSRSSTLLGSNRPHFLRAWTWIDGASVPRPTTRGCSMHALTWKQPKPGPERPSHPLPLTYFSCTRRPRRQVLLAPLPADRPAGRRPPFITCELQLLEQANPWYRT